MAISSFTSWRLVRGVRRLPPGLPLPGDLLRKPAGALEEMKLVVILPGQNILLPHVVEGADQLHAGKIGAVKLRHHGIELASVEDPHEGGLDHIVEMVAQSDFIAAQSLGVGVEKSPAHPGAEIAGGVFF